MTALIDQKLKELPRSPGVYFHKDHQGQIIYVGKAAILRNRVRQYFQASRTRDPKTEALVREIVDIDWMVVDSELEAIFLEAEMIRRYMPRFNILLRDDKMMSYIRIDYNSDFPTVTTTRRPLDDGARYFGPYTSTASIRQALKILRRIFPFATQRRTSGRRTSLYYHLGLDPGLEAGKTSLANYRANLRKLIAVIEGRRHAIEREIETAMKQAAKQHDYEAAARLRNQLLNLQSINQQIVFSNKEFLDLSKDHALNELVNLLTLEQNPRRIEGYDISHQSGTDVVASMVVFTNGVSDKAQYRKFKTRANLNNDFLNIKETISRRLSLKNLSSWGQPDLVLIDGGKGQLDAALQARDLQGCHKIAFIGIAKREEQIVIHKTKSNVRLNLDFLNNIGGFSTDTEDFILVNVPHSTNIVKLLQRIRDESHRFAVSYHSLLKTKRQTLSRLEDIAGVGPLSRKKLLRTFGSLKGVMQASDADLALVVGKHKATIIKSNLPPL